MAGDKPDVLLVGAKKPVMMKGFEGKVTLHHWLDAKDKAAFVKEVGDKIKAIAIAYTANKVDGNFLRQLPNLEQVSSFGVGYDHIDAKRAGEHGIVVTNTPEVLNTKRSRTPRSASYSAPCANSPSQIATCAPEMEGSLTIGSQRRRCAIVRSEWLEWGELARRSRGDSKRSACRSCTTAGTSSRASITSIIRSSSTWRATSTRLWHRAGRRRHQEHDQRRSAQGARSPRCPD